jgi:hypothetical protein
MFPIHAETAVLKWQTGTGTSFASARPSSHVAVIVVE